MRIAIICALLPSLAFAESNTNYHLVGWTNMFIPGGGEFIQGNLGRGSLEAILEFGTFYAGYRNSKRSPLSLDGVPEDLPARNSGTTPVFKFKRKCTTVKGKRVCTDATDASGAAIPADADISRSLYADWLQEFGLKLHFVDVFDTYRSAAGGRGSIAGQSIDKTDTSKLFLAPFYWENISSPWVYAAVAVSAAALVYNYNQVIRDGELQTVGAINRRSRRQYELTYIGVFPTGSAAPEEMFYRGFLQHEFYSMVQSPVFSIGLSSTAYAFSHSGDDRLSAGLTGLYLGLLTHLDKGKLSKAIAYHFWADVLAGLYQVAIVRKETSHGPMINLSLKF